MSFRGHPLPMIGSYCARRLAGLTLLAIVVYPAAAQDVRGLEHCSAEKNLERRTSCLQSNTEFLQQRLNRMAQETQQKQAAAERELAATKAKLAATETEIAGLKEALAKLRGQVEVLRELKSSSEKVK